MELRLRSKHPPPIPRPDGRPQHIRRGYPHGDRETASSHVRLMKVPVGSDHEHGRCTKLIDNEECLGSVRQGDLPWSSSCQNISGSARHRKRVHTFEQAHPKAAEIHVTWDTSPIGLKKKIVVSRSPSRLFAGGNGQAQALRP